MAAVEEKEGKTVAVSSASTPPQVWNHVTRSFVGWLAIVMSGGRSRSIICKQRDRQCTRWEGVGGGVRSSLINLIRF